MSLRIAQFEVTAAGQYRLAGVRIRSSLTPNRPLETGAIQVRVLRYASWMNSSAKKKTVPTSFPNGHSTLDAEQVFLHWLQQPLRILRSLLWISILTPSRLRQKTSKEIQERETG